MGVPLRPLAVAGARSVYREVAPPAALADVLVCGWHGRTGWARPLRVLPDGCADRVWDGDALTVAVTVGVPLRLWLPAAGTRVGVRLRCGAAAAVLGTPMPELPAGTTRLSDLWGAPARRAEGALAATADPVAQREILEALVAGRGAAPDRRVLAAIHALGRPAVRATDVAAELGVSERALRRHFAHAVGAGPKQVHRIRRFQRFLRRLEPLAVQRASLAGVAADLGYADQSHLGRDCRRLSGSSPAALVRVAEKFQTPAAAPGQDPGHGFPGDDSRAL
ncbi:helix-turn-helix domain-containing protein [Amycolatopsis sp. cg9]|uniref:helix-turn-helix domain-containing protein n=1 Tax=Amycolatopsis sp. cg9 TaxID=3238801 RepID=UPI0035243401